MLMLRRLTISILLGSVCLHAQSVPSTYQSLYSGLQSELQSFEGQLQWNGVKSSTLFSASLLYANANSGLLLLNPGARSQYLTELAAIKGLGCKAVVVDMGFPVLYAPFYQFNGDPQDYQSMLNFYTQLVADAHAAGMKVIVEAAAAFPGYYSEDSGLNFGGYFAELSLQEYEQAQATQYATIYTVVQPDYLTLAAEPDTDSTNSAQPELDSPTGWASALTVFLSQLPAEPHTIPIGTGVGNWLVLTGTEFIAAEAAVPGIDYIDLHFYPMAIEPDGGNTVTNIYSEINAALATGKPVAASEWWLEKESTSDFTGENVQTPTINSRDDFSFWAPLDVEFLSDMYKLANWKGFLFGSAFWTNFFWSYIPYDSSLSADQADTAEQTASSSALTAGVITSAGIQGEKAWLVGAPPSPTAASSANYTSAIADASLASLFGLGMAAESAAAQGTLGTSLGGVSITLTDSANNTQQAELLYVSPSQINFAVPSGLAAGPVTAMVLGGGATQTTTFTMSAVAPGIFTVNGTGAGAPAADVYTAVGSNQTVSFAFSCGSGGCVPAPIVVNGAGSTVYLVLYGTGIRNAGSVTLTVGSATLPVAFYGAAPGFTGLDQINVQLPASLAGAGMVTVQLTADGLNANPVQIEIQ
jgi:uncharacterized protein (TIGR03437 family)